MKTFIKLTGYRQQDLANSMGMTKQWLSNLTYSTSLTRNLAFIAVLLKMSAQKQKELLDQYKRIEDFKQTLLTLEFKESEE